MDGRKDVSAKIRTGIVGESTYNCLLDLVSSLSCARVILHARDAVLDISPKVMGDLEFTGNLVN